MPTVAFHTLGCKVNQYDSQAMLECFLRRGYTQVPFEETADVYVVNTCTVTGTGDKKSMQALRRALRQNPAADVVVAGCLAQRDGEKLLASGVRLVIGNSRRAQVADLLEEAVREGRRVAAVEKDILRVPFEPLEISDFSERTRAALKIQEGCDRYCSYCIIPYVRGGIRSRPAGQIRQEALRIAQKGFREIVLTGIHLTSYGRDLDHGSLPDAAEACAVDGILRIRLGSLEPVAVTEEFVRRLRAIPQVCPQFHLALQSGSDAVLRRMRRRYTAGQFLEAADLLRQSFPGCALTTDVICGFPGETEDEFEETKAFVRRAAFSRMHVFPYSRREGTPAASMPGQLPKAVREARTRELISIGHDLAFAYHRSLVGTERELLCEEVSPDGAAGYTREYIPCTVTLAGPPAPGSVLRVTVSSADPDGITAVPAVKEE